MVEQMPWVNGDGLRRPKGASGLDGGEYAPVELLAASLARFEGQVHAGTRILPADYLRNQLVAAILGNIEPARQACRACLSIGEGLRQEPELITCQVPLES